VVGDIWPDSHHLRLELPDKKQIFRKIFHRLVGRPDHEAGAHLIAGFLQRPQAFHPGMQRLIFRVERAVVVRVGGFMPQQIAVSPRLKVFPIGLLAFFSDGKGDGAVGIAFFDGAYQTDDIPIRIKRVFAPLQNESTEAQPVAAFTAGQNFFLRQAVAFRPVIAAPDSAVVAVVAAVVGKLDQPADVNPVPEMFFGHAPGQLKKVFAVFRCAVA